LEVNIYNIVDCALQENVKKWYPSGEGLLKDAENRVLAAAKSWGLANLKPVTGGGASLVCSALLKEKKEVIVKANLYPSDAQPEKIGLNLLQTQSLMPKVLKHQYGVLLLEKINGFPLATYDGEIIADILGKLHEKPREQNPQWSKVPSWSDRKRVLFDGYAKRCKVKVKKFRSIVTKAESELPNLLKTPHTIIHGDVLRKNILQTSNGKTYILDPLTTISPLGWEFAHAACAVQAQNGQGYVIVDKGLQLQVADLKKWLLIASVHHSLGNDGDAGTQRRIWLWELLQYYS
jgi:streptomycin 6-kinase